MGESVYEDFKTSSFLGWAEDCKSNGVEMEGGILEVPRVILEGKSKLTLEIVDLGQRFGCTATACINFKETATHCTQLLCHGGTRATKLMS